MTRIDSFTDNIERTIWDDRVIRSLEMASMTTGDKIFAFRKIIRTAPFASLEERRELKRFAEWSIEEDAYFLSAPTTTRIVQQISASSPSWLVDVDVPIEDLKSKGWPDLLDWILKYSPDENETALALALLKRRLLMRTLLDFENGDRRFYPRSEIDDIEEHFDWSEDELEELRLDLLFLGEVVDRAENDRSAIYEMSHFNFPSPEWIRPTDENLEVDGSGDAHHE